MTRSYLGCVATVLCLSVAGCGSVDPSANEIDPDTGELGSTEEELAAYNFTGWTAWTMPINVCFKAFTKTKDSEAILEPTPQQYSDLKDLTMAGLKETWQRVPGVSFNNKGECTDAMGGYLHATIQYKRGGGGECQSGVGSLCTLSGAADDDWAKGVYKGLVAHEVGHALGMAHEHQRSDNEAVSCEYTRVQACKRCLAALDGGGACAAADWNACAAGDPLLPAPVNTPQTFAKDSDEYALIGVMLHNNGPKSDLQLLTEADPLSIMNYCAGLNGRASDDYHLTSLDLLGMEMTYPKNRTYPLACRSGCMHSGTGVITRTDGTITTNWRERGGLNVSMISPTGSKVSYLKTNTYAAGSNNVSLKFVAPRTGTQLTMSGTLLNSNAYHAAIVSTL